MYSELNNIVGADIKRTYTINEETSQIEFDDVFKYGITNEGSNNVIIDDTYILKPSYVYSADSFFL